MFRSFESCADVGLKIAAKQSLTTVFRHVDHKNITQLTELVWYRTKISNYIYI